MTGDRSAGSGGAVDIPSEAVSAGTEKAAGVDNLLGEFLRARRARLDPTELGVPDHHRRRVPGLRREELALLAGVSPHYYARLEQGRDRHPSPQMLQALAQVLGLDPEAAAHLRRLAEPAPARRRRVRPPEKVRPALRRLLDRWQSEPAVVVGRYRDVLAANGLARILNPGYTPGRNLLRDVFLDPAARDTYPDWEQTADGAVAGLRASAGAEVDDRRLTDLVGELSVRSDAFRRRWARHDVRERTHGTKTFTNPFVGAVTLDYETFHLTDAPGQTLFVFFPQPGSTDEQSLTLLAGLAHGDTESPTP